MATTVRTRWTGGAFIRAFDAHMDKNVERAALSLSGDIVTNFPGLGKGVHSPPGGIPAVQTGEMKRSVTNEKVGPARQNVGSTLQPEPGQVASYALYQELGTTIMAPRPYLRPGLARNRRKINREIQRPFKG